MSARRRESTEAGHGAGPRAADLPRALVDRNVDAPDAVPREALATELARLSALPVPDRVAAWARVFLARGEAIYRLGDEPGGYVTRGLLVDDRHTDCVLFTHRAVELAHAATPEAALAEALARRFPGVRWQDVVHADGRIAYDHPSRIAYAWELVEAGVLGENVTASVGDAVPDGATSRFAAGCVRYVPSAGVAYEALRNGDVVYFILDERHAGAAGAREAVGVAVGHMGIVSVPGGGGAAELVHAASANLPGVYDGGRIVSVPLATYLSRVERFKGIAVTRIGR